MKIICECCKLEKSENEFNWRNKANGILKKACKICTRKQCLKYYRSHKQVYRNILNRQRGNIREMVYDYLSKHPCIDCGEADANVLDFDHVRGKKTDTVSRLIGHSCSWKRIKAEIDRCEVRCANCHRKKTAKQFGWNRNRNL